MRTRWLALLLGLFLLVAQTLPALAKGMEGNPSGTQSGGSPSSPPGTSW